MRRVALLGLLVAGCSRSFSAPAPAQPGTIYGTVEVERDAVEGRVPAAGARVYLQGTSQGVVAGADGRFLLDGITTSNGTLLITYDSDGDGVDDRRTALALQDIHAGPNRQIDLGEIVVARPAAVRGRVRRGDALNDPGGNGGALVFVPEGPASTTTADDGSFTLANLPAGEVDLRVFLPGYAPLAVGTVTLDPGQLVTLSDVVLTPKSGPPGKGSIQLHVDLAPSAALDGTTAAIVGGSQSATTDASGDARIDGVDEGVYALTLHHAGYTDAVVANVPVFADQVTPVTSLLGTGQAVPPPDAGVIVLPDAGILDDGSLVVATSDPSGSDQDAVFGARVTFNREVSTASVTDPSHVQVVDAAGEPVPGTLRYDTNTNTVTLTYDAPLTIDAPYTLRVQGVVSADGRTAALVTPVSIDFTPRRIRWRLFRDPSGVVSGDPDGYGTQPRILWTPQGVHVISRLRGDTSCAGTSDLMVAQSYGRFDPLQVAPDGGLFRPSVPSCVPDLYGDSNLYQQLHHATLLDGSPTAVFSTIEANGHNTAIAQFAGTGWVLRTVAGYVDNGIVSDGASLSLATNYSSGSVIMYGFDSASDSVNPVSDLPLNGGEYIPSAFVIDSAGSADHFFAAISTDLPGVDLDWRDTTGFVYVNSISTNVTPTGVKVLVSDGIPFVLVASTQNSSSIQLFSTGTASIAAGASIYPWGTPLASDPTFDAALLGRTAYVATGLGGVTLHHYFLGGADGGWSDDLGPNAGAISAPNGCLARDPSIAAGDTSLWITWTEGCALSDGGTGYSSVVREAY